MSTRRYNFHSQAKVGEDGYQLFSEYMRWKFPHAHLEKTSLAADLRGTDALLTLGKGKLYRVQVKTDEKASITGNIFLETISDEARGTHGVLYKGDADKLVIVVPQEQVAYFCDMARVREVFQEHWSGRRFPRKPVENDGWITLGICVPREEFELLIRPQVHYLTAYEERSVQEIAPEPEPAPKPASEPTLLQSVLDIFGGEVIASVYTGRPQ